MVARKTQAARREDFEKLAESVPHIVWMSAPDGSTNYFNERGCEYTGLPPQASYGWGWVTLVHEGDARRARRAWEEATRTTTPYEISYRFRRRDGAYRWHDFRALPVRGTDNEVERWIGTATDIEDRVQLAERLMAVETQTVEVLGRLKEVQAQPDGLVSLERAIRSIRVKAALAADRRWPPGRHGSADGTVGAGGDGSAPAGEPLTRKEEDVVALVALGHTNREVACKLAMSLRSVEGYRSRAMSKLAVTTRAELARFAFTTGLVDWT